MDIYAIFNKLRYHYEDEVVEFKKAESNCLRLRGELRNETHGKTSVYMLGKS